MRISDLWTCQACQADRGADPALREKRRLRPDPRPRWRDGVRSRFAAPKRMFHSAALSSPRPPFRGPFSRGGMTSSRRPPNGLSHRIGSGDRARGRRGVFVVLRITGRPQKGRHGLQVCLRFLASGPDSTNHADARRHRSVRRACLQGILTTAV